MARPPRKQKELNAAPATTLIGDSHERHLGRNPLNGLL